MRHDPIPWHQLPEARAILATMATNPPAMIRHERGYTLTGVEWLTYDDADTRVQRLDEIQRIHTAPWLASEEACRDGRTKVAMGCKLDQAIDAVRSAPRIFNLNDPEQRAAYETLRAEILGVRLERSAA